MENVDLNLGSRKLKQRIRQSLDRTVHVALDDEVKLVEVVECAATAELLESDTLLGAHIELTLKLFALRRDIAVPSSRYLVLTSA